MDDKERQARQIAKAFDVPPWVAGIGPVPRWRRVRSWLLRPFRRAHNDGRDGT